MAGRHRRRFALRRKCAPDIRFDAACLPLHRVVRTQGGRALHVGHVDAARFLDFGALWLAAAHRKDPIRKPQLALTRSTLGYPRHQSGGIFVLQKFFLPFIP